VAKLRQVPNVRVTDLHNCTADRMDQHSQRT
jgi:hypothetical protein